MPSRWETYLSWAVRSWDAEVENASRLSTRVNLVLTIALAFVGAGAKLVLDSVIEHPSGYVRRALLGGAVLGVALMFLSFLVVLGSRLSRAQRPFASNRLLPPSVAPPSDGPAGTDDDALFQAFAATAIAAHELHGMNSEERTRIDRGQQWLVLGVFLTVVCGGAYTFYREAPKAAPIRVEWVNRP